MRALDSVHVSMHAIERYMQRIDPCISGEEACDKIKGEVCIARRDRCKLPGNAVAYTGDSARYVVSEEGGERTVVTVLPLHKDEMGCAPELAAEVKSSMEEYSKKDILKSKSFLGTSSKTHTLSLEAMLKEKGKKISELNVEISNLRSQNSKLIKILKRQGIKI